MTRNNPNGSPLDDEEFDPLADDAPLLVIGAWFGWSVFEVLVRWHGKRYVKDGPWWGSVYRRANVMDMLSYVSFKNLLIGAALFWLLARSGMMVVS